MVAPADDGIAVVIPAFQAAATVGAVVAATRRVLPDAGIYVVDDGSTDGTGAVGAGRGALAAIVLALPAHRGKGAALAAGIGRAARDGAEVMVTLDADGQHDPGDIPRLLEPLAAGKADLVLGARPRTRRMPVARRLSNWLSARLATRVAGEGIPDAQTGFRAFTRRLADVVRPRETAYDYELAFLLGALAAGYRVRSVPVATIYDGAASHFRSIVDTWRIARVFARYGGSILIGAK